MIFIWSDKNMQNIEAIKVAAKWWADQLRAPAFDNGVAEHGALAEIVKSTRAAIPEEKLDAFQTDLETRLLGSDLRTLAVDYGPDRTLHDAAWSAGIDADMTSFPWKTCMILSDEVLKVACGYGAPFETIYEKVV
jgi:hypothetical protein